MTAKYQSVSTSELHEGRWRPAVPLPFYGFLHVTCRCGKRFWRSPRAARYEAHYRSEHRDG